MKLDFLKTPTINFGAFYNPLQGLTETLLQDRPTGLSDSRQTLQCPRTRMALLQLRHQETVRQEDQVHVAGLTTAAPKLTFTHAQMLLAIPMEAFCACPTIAIYTKDSSHFPSRSVGDQSLFGFRVLMFAPENHDTDFVIHPRDTDTDGEVPLTRFSDLYNFAILGTNLRGQVLNFEIFAFKEDLTIELDITHIVSLQAVDMVQVVLMSEPTVEGEVAGNLVGNAPVHQLPKQHIMVLEFYASLLTLVLLGKSVEFQGVVLSGGAYVVDNHVIMGNLVALLCMIPEIACIFNQLTVMVHQDIIDRNHTLGTETGVRLNLQPLNPLQIEELFIPNRIR